MKKFILILLFLLLPLCIINGAVRIVTNGNFTLDNESNFDFERTDAFSISFWIRYTAGADFGSNNGLYSKYPGAAPFVYVATIEIGTGRKPTLYIKGSNDAFIRCQGAITFDLNVWKYWTVTYDGSSAQSGVKWYENGVAVACNSDGTALTATILNNTAPTIGSIGGVAYSDCDFAHYSIWSEELSVDKIGNIMNRKLTDGEAGLISYYPMNEGAINLGPGGKTIVDRVDENHGADAGAVSYVDGPPVSTNLGD